MPLKMRATGLGHGVYKDNVDYSVFCGEWCIGRIYETRVVIAGSAIGGAAQARGGPLMPLGDAADHLASQDFPSAEGTRDVSKQVLANLSALGIEPGARRLSPDMR
jgi:hypothetical protein